MFLISSLGSPRVKWSTGHPSPCKGVSNVLTNISGILPKISSKKPLFSSTNFFSNGITDISKRFSATVSKGPHIMPTAEQKMESFYKRPLPEFLISFSSPRGKQLFKETLEKGILESYWSLAEQFHTQSEPACKLILI